MTTNLHWSEIDKIKMRETAEAHMMETVYRHVYSCSFDDFGDIIETWTKDPTPIIGGFSMFGHRDMGFGIEKELDTMTIISYDAILRVPYGTVLDLRDRIEVANLRGDTTYTQMFDIVTIVIVGVSAYIVRLRKLEL